MVLEFYELSDYHNSSTIAFHPLSKIFPSPEAPIFRFYHLPWCRSRLLNTWSFFVVSVFPCYLLKSHDE